MTFKSDLTTDQVFCVKLTLHIQKDFQITNLLMKIKKINVI